MKVDQEGVSYGIYCWEEIVSNQKFCIFSEMQGLIAKISKTLTNFFFKSFIPKSPKYPLALSRIYNQRPVRMPP
jgi:hypothetical protein